MSAEIDAFLGEDGQAALLSKISVGPILNDRGSSSRQVRDLDEFVHLFRRLQTPYYEEARRHFRCPGVLERLYDTNEFYPYQPKVLRHIADHDGECVFA